MKLKKRFKEHKDIYSGMFHLVENKRSKRPDLHAFLLIDELMPDSGFDMVAYAEHDQIWLEVNPEELNKVITDDQVLELARCGVFYDKEADSLSMFV